MRDEFNVNRVMLGGKIDPLSEIRNAGIVTNGSVFWVKPVTDADYTTFQSNVGQQNTFGTIQGAIDKARDDKNDYVLLTVPDSNAPYSPGSALGAAGTGAGTTALTVNKDRLHLIGVGFNRVADQYAITVRGFGTAAAGTPVASALVDVYAGGVEIAGIKFLGTMGTSAGGTVGRILNIGTSAAGTAHDLWVHDSALEWSSQTGLFEVACVTTPGTVHNARFENNFIGNAADFLEGAGAGVVALGAGGRRWRFINNTFVMAGGSTAHPFVACGTGAKQYTIFENNKFFQLGTVTQTSAFTGSVTVNNPVLLFGNVSAGSTTQMGTDPTVFKAPVASGTSAAIRDYGLAVGTAALVPA